LKLVGCLCFQMYKCARGNVIRVNSHDYHVWRLEEVESCLEKSPGRSTEYLELAHLFPVKYRQSYESRSPDESHFLNGKWCKTKLHKRMSASWYCILNSNMWTLWSWSDCIMRWTDKLCFLSNRQILGS
jgi:hypothetical protein